MDRSVRRLGVALLVLSALVLAACGSTNPSNVPSNGDRGSPLASGLIVLSSPPLQPPTGLADPSTPAYQASSGFTPDAIRVLTVLSFQVALERYRHEHAAYPTALATLFPTDAPIGPDNLPLSGPPTTADGYTYTLDTPTTYTLAAVLASGQTYTVHAPGGP